MMEQSSYLQGGENSQKPHNLSMNQNNVDISQEQYSSTMIVRPDNYDGDVNSQEFIHCLKVENQALKEEVHEFRNKVKDVEFENEQLRQKCS